MTAEVCTQNISQTFTHALFVDSGRSTQPGGAESFAEGFDASSSEEEEEEEDAWEDGGEQADFLPIDEVSEGLLFGRFASILAAVRFFQPESNLYIIRLFEESTELSLGSTEGRVHLDVVQDNRRANARNDRSKI